MSCSTMTIDRPSRDDLRQPGIEVAHHDGREAEADLVA
jgi:hypothetical protein